MNPHISATPGIDQAPSTAGMTTKVVKGSIWTLIGQVLPVGVALVTSPIVIRLLGAEGYGVMVLIVLIPTYFAFADFGMGMASTKFGSEAYASGSREKEARIVRTAALIVLASSIPVAIAIFLLSGIITEWFNVPDHLRGDATTGLRLAALTIVTNFLCLVFNTPQLTRLRMDLNTLVNTGFRVLGAIAIPIVIYLGGRLTGVFVVLAVMSVLTLAGHIFFSGRLLKELFRTTIERSAIRPMLKFGGSLVIASVAAILLGNLERLVLTRATSVETLAYYSVATTFASMITLFSGSMLQSLLPAFTQLQGESNREALNTLYSRGIRINMIWVVPVIIVLALAAKVLITLWAGEDFGRESTVPFYIILAGLTFNVFAFFPWVSIMAAGRSDIFAKLYWLELVPYIFIVSWLASRYGARGAAAAWSVRVVVDAVALFLFARKVGNVTYLHRDFWRSLFVYSIMLVPLAAFLYFQELNPAVIVITLITLAVYALAVWKLVLEKEEVLWFKGKLNAFFK